MRATLHRPVALPLALAVVAALPLISLAQEAPASELGARREQLMERLADGIVLLHARSLAKAEDQPGFLQDASFFYFTGLSVQPAAILALDGQRRETRLFVPPAPMSFGQPVDGLGPSPGPSSARKLGLTAVQPWDQFQPWLQERLEASPVKLYVDAPRPAEATGTPEPLLAVAGDLGLWRQALRQAFPDAVIESALPVLREMRWVKSPSEIAALRANAIATVAALHAAAARIEPGIRQRQVEATVIAACIEAGAHGPSFWPWAMSGPNARVDNLVRAFYSYEHLDRTLLAGELVRVDIGCRGHGYGADVGRTIPVDGEFSAPQAETWELLTSAYLAGLEAMRADTTVSAVRAASRARVRELTPALRTDTARRAAELLDSDSAWHLHGVGIESGEEALPILRAGTVLAYEPMVTVGADAFYLEDMILVTETGHEVLSAGLPYSANKIGALVSSGSSGSER